MPNTDGLAGRAAIVTGGAQGIGRAIHILVNDAGQLGFTRHCPDFPTTGDHS